MNYIVRLAGPDMDGQAISCLGSQLVELVELLNTREGGLTWGVFNLEPLSGAASVALDGNDQTWSSDDVVRLGRSKYQFLRGVFVAVRLGVQIPRLRSDIDTEDPSMWNCEARLQRSARSTPAFLKSSRRSRW